MSQDEFNRAFQDAVARHVPVPARSADDLVAQLLRRDQRRTRWLAAASLACWLLGAAGMILLIVGLNRYIIGVRIEHLVLADRSPVSSPVSTPNSRTFDAQEQFILSTTDLIHHSMPYLAASVVALLLAALFTVLLVFSSRQATLNRINFSLSLIAADIRRLRTGVDPAVPQGALDFALPTPFSRRRVWTWTGVTAAFLVVAAVVSLVANGHHLSRTAAIWQDYPRRSPFEAIRWSGPTPQVHFRTSATHATADWYTLVAINGVPVDQIIAYSKAMDATTWRKHFEEDLVELMTRMGHTPAANVSLDLKDLSGQPLTLRDVPMTEANRQAILQANLGRPTDDAAPPATAP